MATIGGNLLQRTRCRYFRDPEVTACNKRAPGVRLRGPARVRRGCTRSWAPANTASRCTPRTCACRWSRSMPSCTSEGAGGQRSVPLTEFYVLPGDRPDIENVLEHGELITRVRDTAAAGRHAVGLPEGARPRLLRVRAHLRGRGAADRGRHDRPRRAWLSAVSGRCRGGLARPRRSSTAHRASDQTFRAAAEAALRDPFTVPGTAFKVELAQRTIVRILQTVSGARS